ncbi:hypothetical protein AHEVV1_007 [Adoxophyes honmai entomopoxvirus 'L' virophage 1]|nr:hypothetical protein AHEVV1_007 [Adoxophyes honmai entomopoxvirus 'L' virophage 1]
MVTSNHELDAYGNKFLCPFYKNCIMKDDFVMYNNDIFYQIINIGNKTGTHWVCVVKIFNSVYYHDTFGTVPVNIIVEYCNKLGYNLYYNTEKYQEFTEENCGERCLCVLAKIHIYLDFMS